MGLPGLAGDILQHYQDTQLGGSREEIGLYFPATLVSGSKDNETFGGGWSYGSVWGPATAGSGGGAGGGIDGMGGSGGGAVRVVVRRGVLSIDSTSRISADGQSVMLNNSALVGDWSLMDASANDWMGFRGGAGTLSAQLTNALGGQL